jgi:hypothetical protein
MNMRSLLRILMPRRHWFQFSLRSLLVLALLVGVGASLLVRYERSFRVQDEAAERLREIGATVQTGPGAPDWIRRLFGQGRFQSVVMVHLEHRKFLSQDLASLEDLPDLERLYLAGSSVDDQGLTHVRELKKLRRMSLWRTKVTDDGMANLAGLTRLEALDVHRTQLTDKCLAHLSRMSRLRKLRFDFHLTDRGLRRLAALPSLQVHPRSPLRCFEVTGDGLRWLTQISDVGNLSLDSSVLTDADLEPLTRLPKLNVLKLRTPGITDEGLDVLGRTPCAKLSITEADVSLPGAVAAYGHRTGFLGLWPHAVTLSSQTLVGDAMIGGTDARGSVSTQVTLQTRLQEGDLDVLERCPRLIGVSLVGDEDAGLQRAKRVLALIRKQAALEELIYVGPGDPAVLSAMGELTGLRRLVIRSDLSSDALLLEPLGRLRRLEHLSLRATGIDDERLSFIEHLTELRTLDLGENRIVGPGMKHLAGLSKLKNLWLIDCNRFTDEGMEHMPSLTGLEDLVIQHTQVTDAGLKSLDGLPNLRCVETTGTRVTQRGRMRLTTSLQAKRLSP